MMMTLFQLCFLWLVLGPTASAQDAPPPPPEAPEWATIEDPRRLEDLAAEALAAGMSADFEARMIARWRERNP